MSTKTVKRPAKPKSPPEWYWARTSDPQLVDFARGLTQNFRHPRKPLDAHFCVPSTSERVCPLVAER